MIAMKEKAETEQCCPSLGIFIWKDIWDVSQHCSLPLKESSQFDFGIQKEEIIGL